MSLYGKQPEGQVPVVGHLIHGKASDGKAYAIGVTTGGSVKIDLSQSLDDNNTKVVTSADAQPGNPWVGTWTQTRSLGYVRELVVLAATDQTAGGLGGTFTFEYSEDGVTNNGISEPRTIHDFATVRDFDLLNAGEYFRVKFEPDRALSSDSVFITTTLRKQNDGAFVRLAGQEIEEDNAAMPQTFAYVKAFDKETGKSVNIRPTENGALSVSDERLFVSQSGSVFTEGIRDDISLIFSRDSYAASVLKLVDHSSGGTISQDATEGRAVLEATAGNISYFESEDNVQYDPGHMIVGGQTIRIHTLPTGTSKIEWGFGEDDGANDTLNAIGNGVDATGFYAFRKKNGSYASKVYQTDFNRDLLDGNAKSKYHVDGLATAITLTNNFIFEFGYEWYGVAPPTYIIGEPSGLRIPYHIEETSGEITGTTIPEPDLPLFIRIESDSQTLQVSTGSWRGGVFTEKQISIGRDPDGNFADIPAGGVVSAATTTDTLGSSGVYNSEIILSDGYVGIGIVITTDVVSASDGIKILHYKDSAGTLLMHTDKYTYGAAQVSSGSMVITSYPKANYYKVQYTNGGTGQSTFRLQTNMQAAAFEQPRQSVEGTITNASTATMTRTILNAKNDAGVYDNITRGNSGGLRVSVNEHEAEMKVKPLDSFDNTVPSLTTTATKIVDSASMPAGTKTIVIQAGGGNGNKIVYLAKSSALATVTGAMFELAATQAITIELGDQLLNDVWAAMDSSTGRCRVLYIKDSTA